MQEFRSTDGMWLTDEYELIKSLRTKQHIDYTTSQKGVVIDFQGNALSEQAKKLSPLQIIALVCGGCYTFMSSITINEDGSFFGNYFID